VGRGCQTPPKYGVSIYELAQTKVYLIKTIAISSEHIRKHKMMNN